VHGAAFLESVDADYLPRGMVAGEVLLDVPGEADVAHVLEEDAIIGVQEAGN
jgi:hypothetical protein